MKTLLNFNKIFILGLLIILSCDDKGVVQPTVDFDYTIVLTPSSENETYYADGCSGCTDYNPITFIATLESSNESVAGKTINFSYNSDSFNHATSPFSSDGPTTQSNGKAQVTYDDRGFSGDVTISASFTESTGFSDSTITTSIEVNLQPYYLKVNAVSMYVTSSGITAGDLNSSTSISFFVTDENNIGLPNVPVLFSKNSSVGTFYSNTNAFNAEQARTDAQGVAAVNFTIADATVSEESIVISAVVDDSNIDDPTNFTSNTEITIVPLDIPQYTLTLDRISEGEEIVVDEVTSNLFYSDLDAKSIIYQATLRDGDNAVVGRNINFSYTNMEGSAITNAYFQSIDLSTQSNGTFKTDYNDGGENGAVIITANFSDTQYSVSISKSDTLTITPYYEAVATVSGWTDDPEIISGIDAATTESTRIWTQVLDANGLPLKNVQIVFGVNESSDNTQPNIGSFITDFISYTDAAGKAYVDYEAFPNTPGGDLNVTIDIVGDPDENNENHKEISITVNEPKFDYCLLLESAEGNNYSDLNNTTTLFEATLLNVFCADGITSAACCADPLVVADGDPVDNQTLQIDFTNSEHSVPLGEVQLIDPLTDSNGKMKFEYLDNGETGSIDLTVSYTDVFGNSPDNATNTFTVYPVEQLVQTVFLTSDPVDYVIITDTTVVYETVFTTLISDNNGASVPNVNVDFYNNWTVSDVPQGTLSSSSCVTSENGSCEITLTSIQSQVGSAEIVACVSFTELTRAYEESNGDLTFSWIEEAKPISSSKSKGKNKKSIRNNNFTLKINEFKNSLAYQTQSEDRVVCASGVSGSHSVEFIEEQQYYINQVNSIDVWVIAEEVIEDNINVTVVDTIFARAINSAGQGLKNVPIQFNKTTDGFGYISSSESITDSTGLAMTIYYPNTESYSGSDDTVDINFTIGVAGNDAVVDVNQQITLDTSGNVNVELDVTYFDFYPNISNISHIMGNETSISVIAKNENGVGMANVPIRFSISSATDPSCQGSSGCESYSNSTACDADASGIGDCSWNVVSPSGILSEFLVPTCCDDESASDDGGATETSDSTAVTQPGVARISYWNSEGQSDKLRAYIVHPLNANQILFEDEVTITTTLDIPQYTLTLDRISEGEEIVVDEVTSNLFYSDLDAKSIIYQATLRDGDNAVVGRNINFSYTNMEGSAITNAYFQSIDLSTQSNGTFKTDYNDGGENGAVIITANFSDTQYSVSISKSDTLTITPYYEAVATVSGWTDDPEIISGIDAATTESTRIWTQVLDANGLPLKNVQIVFGVNESSDNTQPNIGSFITDFISYTDAAGKAYVDYEAFPNTPGGDLNVTIDIVGDPDENNENHKEISITVNEPKFDYCLLLESAEGNNYSDLNNTTTLFEATLLNVFCADGITSAACCADPLVVADGDPVDNQTLQIDFTNSEHSVPLGEVQLIDPLTDSNGKMKFEYLDNGETGSIDLTVSYTDVFGNSPDNATNTFTVYPVEQLVQTVFLTSDPVDYVIITDTTVVYETVFTTLISDNNGASVPNVNVDFYNNWTVSDVPQGTLSSSSCVTSENGSCEITLTSIQSQVGSAEIVACVSFTELTRAYEESNGDLTFSWIEEAKPISSSKSKGKNKKSIRNNNFTLKINEFKNSLAYQTQSEDRVVCASGVSGSHSVEFIEEQQYYINQVNSIDVWVIAEEVIEDNINVTVVDTIFARAINSAGQGLKNVPIQFNKTTDGFGYISSSESITDSTGLAMTIYYPNTESYSGSDDTVDINFTIGVAGNDAVVDVNQQITLDTSGNVNVELDVTYFDFYPNISNISHIMGNETSISVIAKNENGVGMANVPIRFSISSATDPSCQGSSGCESYSNSTACDADASGIGDCSWNVVSPSGILSEFLVPTCCDDESASDDGGATETSDSTAVTQPGVARISYWNSEGQSDKLRAYIVHPLNANQILFEDEVTITTNITTGLITWAQMSTVSVASLDSLYCDSLYVTAIDGNGNTLADIPVTFNLDDNVSGSINVINPQTGSNGSPASALFCPVQGFVGYCDESDGNDGCNNYSTELTCAEDVNTLGDCSWENEVSIDVSTSVANVDNSTINITYFDATPECPECVAELKLEADDFILPSERSGTCSGTTGCELNTLEETCSEDALGCSWEGSGSTYITTTLIDSLGYGPVDNTHIFYQAIQQVPEEDNPDNLVWEPVGSIPEIDYFLNDTSKVLFNMENASGLIAIVGNAEALTDTIYLQLKSTTPSYIEIFDPYPSDIMVQGGGGQASTDINVSIRDANGSNVDKPFWVKFTIVGFSPSGVHINGEPGTISVDQLSLNGESSISINAGTAPGTVRIKVELYEDNSGVMGDAVSGVPTEEKNIVTVITGPPAQGVINYSYVDITAIDGGLYEVPVTVMLSDVHSNPVNDSTSVYFDVRGITDQYDAAMTYVNGDIVYWGSAPETRNETPDSLVYKCYNPVHGVCQLSEVGIIPDIPDDLVNNPPDGSGVLEHCVGEDPNGVIDCTDNSNSTDCIADVIGGACEGEFWQCETLNVEGTCNAMAGAGCIWVQSTCEWESIFDVNTTGELWIPQIHPASIEGAAKTGNENSNGEAYSGVANTVLRFGSSDIFAETVIRAHTLGLDGESLIIDSRASHSGENLVLPLTADGNLSVSANPLAWDFSTVGDPDGNYDPNDPPIITVTATLSDYYQYFIDAGLLTISAPFGTVVSVCNGIDGDGNGVTGSCADNDGNSLPFSTCSTCGDEGGVWTPDPGDSDPGNLGFGKTNSSGQVVWEVQYDFGINVCDDCADAQNPTCEDRESNIVVQLMDPLSQASDPVIVVLSQSVACE